MEFKKLEIKEEGSWLKRSFGTQHAKKTIIYILIGIAGGGTYYLLSEGATIDAITSGNFIKSMLVGGFFGFFVTNSPCARGRC